METQTKQLHGQRIEYIDGIRGIAAIFVVLCHLAAVFVPGLCFMDDAQNEVQKALVSLPLNLATFGDAAIQLFFVFSGFLITRQIYTKGTNAIKSPIKLYIKLLKLIAPAVLFAYLLMEFNLMYHLRALVLDTQLYFAWPSNNFEPTIPSLILNIFVKPFIISSDYVGPLWTIKDEFAGALIITAISYLTFNSPKFSKLTYIFFFIILCKVNENLPSFIFGGFIFDCIYREKTDTSIIGKIVSQFINKRILRYLLLLVGLYFISMNFCVRVGLAPFKQPPVHMYTVIGAGSAIVWFCLIHSPFMQKILSFKGFLWLGKLSAYIYAFHWPMILSLGCFIHYTLYGKMDRTLLIAIIAVAVSLATFSMAYFYVKMQTKVEKKLYLMKKERQLVKQDL